MIRTEQERDLEFERSRGKVNGADETERQRQVEENEKERRIWKKKNLTFCFGEKKGERKIDSARGGGAGVFVVHSSLCAFFFTLSICFFCPIASSPTCS